jgi:hypothetical protein
LSTPPAATPISPPRLIQNDAVDATAVRDALINSREGSFRVVWDKALRDKAAVAKGRWLLMSSPNGCDPICRQHSLPEGASGCFRGDHEVYGVYLNPLLHCMLIGRH